MIFVEKKRGAGASYYLILKWRGYKTIKLCSKIAKIRNSEKEIHKFNMIHFPLERIMIFGQLNNWSFIQNKLLGVL